MALSEFALIDRFFRDCGATRSDVPLGIGDDAAVLDVPPGKQLVAAIDTIVEGVHFPKGSAPASIGHRALAVNLSDLAAMGAEPAWALLSLTLPQADEQWLTEFSRGLGALARAHNVALVGGDTTSGPLSITIQVLGFIEPTRALRRAGGRAGDAVFVSGTPGDAAGGLALELSPSANDTPAHMALRERFLFPTPRLELGRLLLDFASACIDVSDGLLGDAGKLAQASGCGVQLDYAALPVSPGLVAAVGEHRARELALTGGDDYELCFTVSPSRIEDMLNAVPAGKWGYTRIGVLTADPRAAVIRDGSVMQVSHSGFDHFASPR
jgi:thiamine-monophosphate kinase